MPTEYFLAHIWLIPLFPLAGAALMLFIGRRLPNAGVNVICVGSVFLAMCYAFGAIWQLIARPVAERVVEAITCLTGCPPARCTRTPGRLVNFNAPWGMLIDPLTCVMLLRGHRRWLPDPCLLDRLHGARRRLLPLLRLPESLHVLDADADHWRTTCCCCSSAGKASGLCSYLLIGFYFLRKSASDAGKKAFIVNRIGDAGFILGLFLLLGHAGHDAVHGTRPGDCRGAFCSGRRHADGDCAAAVCRRDREVGAASVVCLAAGRDGRPHARQRVDPRRDDGDRRRVHDHAHERGVLTWRRRRWPWWPRLAPSLRFLRRPWAWCRTTSSACWPIPPCRSWATCSWRCGVGAFTAGIFHLMTHAFFKALLFLGSGSVIHAMSGEQDMRKMGGAVGQDSDDGEDVLDRVHRHRRNSAAGRILQQRRDPRHAFEYNQFLWLIGFITAGMTAFYMFRLVNMTFFGNSRVDHEVEHHIHESPASMTVPLMILAGLSIVGGWIGWPESLGGSDRFAKFLEPVMAKHAEEGGEAAAQAASGASMEYLLMLLSVAGCAVSASGWRIAGTFSSRKFRKKSRRPARSCTSCSTTSTTSTRFTTRCS